MDEAPDGFLDQFWPCFLDCCCDLGYWFSIDEVMLICKAADINVVVFQLVDSQLKLKDYCLSNCRREEPFVSIMLDS